MRKKGMYRVFVFLIAFVVCDAVAGAVAKALFYSQKSGKYARLTTIVKTDTAEIIVLGSSHVMAHFIPAVIRDSLHESAYNYGANGQKLLFARAIYEIRKKRSTPKMIILNVDADWFFDRHNQQDRMSDLYPYYGSDGDIIFRDFDRKDRLIGRLKFLSRTFPYNSTIVHVIKYKLKPQVDFDGYEPLYGAVDSLQLAQALGAEEAKTDRTPPRPDTGLLELFSRFIGEIQRDRVKLYVVFSPELVKPDFFEASMIRKIKTICDSGGVSVVDFSGSDMFNNHRLLFHDFGHLNDSGAHLLTGMLIDSVRLRTNTR
ncbi:MAG TPA: hypothetical protein VMH27_00660 [Puia sp.]|nr:hypothetical protein [Puia sp.]